MHTASSFFFRAPWFTTCLAVLFLAPLQTQAQESATNKTANIAADEAGSLYGLAAVDPRPDESAEVWHSYEIHCVGNRYTVIADGVTCVQSTDANKALLAARSTVMSACKTPTKKHRATLNTATSASRNSSESDSSF